MNPGTTIAQYEILEQLGKGGMGVVYKARDTKLDRFVALKFLPPHLSADDDAKARFVQEAKAASALDHPNICAIYEIGEASDGKLYIAMPFYDGQTLKYRLDNGPLDVDEAVRIAQELAQGLERAHEAGIVHRDIKPANIMVTNRGEVKILDFGVAKLGEGVGLTMTGSTVGTVSYMSPEQASGHGSDQRSDVWALGVVLYEMLAGEKPFEGDYQQAVIYNILNEEPKTIRSLNPGVSPRIAGLVDRLLRKNPDERFQTASELLRALVASPDREPGSVMERRPHFLLNKPTLVGIAVVLIAAVGLLMFGGEGTQIPGGTTAVKSSSLAVLPFSNLRADPETDFLGFALADQVIGSLSLVRDLRVKPSSVVREYSDGRYDVGHVGDKLDVSYVVAGNYLKEADKIRLTVEMVDVGTGEMVWREPIEVQYEDAFSLQDLVSKTVLEKLQLTFSTSGSGTLSDEAPPDPAAYEYYLRSLPQPETYEGNRVAIELLSQAVRIDSSFASAWSELGFRYRMAGRSSTSVADIEAAEEAFLEALKINPNHLDALGNVASLYTDIGRYEEAFEKIKHLLDLNPRSAIGHLSLGYLYRYAGMIDESVAEMRLALSLDSTDARFRTAGRTFLQAGLYDESASAFRIGQESAYGLSQQAWNLMYQGDTEAAKRLLARFNDRYRDDPLYAVAFDGLGAYLDSDPDRGMEALHTLEERRPADSEVWFDLARLHCLLGDADGCVRCFQTSVGMGYVAVPWFRKDFALDLVREDPRFQAAMEVARKRHEELKAKFSAE